MVRIEDLPRDANGIVQGAWRVLWETPDFTGELGVVRLVDGAATAPLFGRQLCALVAEYGHHLYLEPWGEPLPAGVVLPELVEADADASALPTCPWRDVDDDDAGDGSVDYDALDLEELRALATDRGIEGGERWAAARIRKALRSLDASDASDDPPSSGDAG